MGLAYWNQFDNTEIMSMHGLELDCLHDDDDDFDCDEDENDDECDSCPRCTGTGCNYCLMLEW